MSNETEKTRKQRQNECMYVCKCMYVCVCGARTKPDHLDSIAWIRVLALQIQWYFVSLSLISLHSPTTMPPGPYSCSEEFEIDPAIKQQNNSVTNSPNPSMQLSYALITVQSGLWILPVAFWTFHAQIPTLDLY